MEDAEDGVSANKVKWIIIFVLVGSVLLLLIVGSIISAGKVATSNPNGVIATNPTPTLSSTKPPEGEARLVVNIQANDPAGNRLTFGPKLPFPIPGEGMADIDGGMVAGGQHKWASPKSGGTEQGIMMLFEPETENMWVRVRIDASIRTSLFGRSLDMAERTVPPVLLVDGQQVGASGFLYEDSGQRAYLLEPTLGLRGLAQAPELRASRNDQTLWLIFRVPKGGYIKSMYYGRRKIMEWEQPVLVPSK